MIDYVDSVLGLSQESLHGFFEGWPNPPSPEAHLRLLTGSDEVVLAVHRERGNAVGFITAITDGVLAAYIPFIEVLPAFQGLGIGEELMSLMLAKLKGLYMVDLLCDSETQPFYRGFGMQPSVGMMLRNYDRQSGGG